ncbi:MAG: putative metal-dependent enzyme [Armatimonadetes bacterium OLB18]|nr:MAG: putative metal-dependent enzyme [Armatimonadetes bacterium OLB18]
MRSPKHFSVGVRAPNGELVLQCEPLEKTWIGRQRWLKLPFLRGTWALLDALTLGYKALRFAGNIQLAPEYQLNEGESKGELDNTPIPPKHNETIGAIQVGMALVVGLLMGLFLFNYLPNFLAIQAKSAGVENPIQINFITEVLKVIFFLGYIYLISLMPDIKRLFQYHGAEHKAINTLEAGHELTLENCRKQTRLHPRCGTSFAIVVLIVSMILFTFMPKPEIESSRILTSIARFLVELPLLPLIAGISFEVIRFAGKMRSSKLINLLLWPGLMSQYLTTRVPDDSMIEVALAALRAVVEADVKQNRVRTRVQDLPQQPRARPKRGPTEPTRTRRSRSGRTPRRRPRSPAARRPSSFGCTTPKRHR